MNKFTNFIGDNYRNVASGFMSVLKDSKFYQEGVLTPEEFIAAGDYLTQKCPTWKWCSVSDSQDIKPVDYLPKNKQYLVTMNVPCPKRASDFALSQKTTEEEVDDEWVATHLDMFGRKKNVEDIIDIDDNSDKINEQNQKKVIENKMVVNENYMDIDVVEDEEEQNKKDNNEIEIVNDDFVVVEENDDNIIKTRTYDISVSYDYYYRVPRMWLTGYNEMGLPLTDNEIKEDIMSDYIDRTVTIEKHPNTGVKSVSIHPCKHSTLLLKMIENYDKAGKTLEVEKSIVLFLKFLHSVVPTIQYDFTMDIDF
jgi:ubiquitin-like-conjugating enzyme ATG3